MPMNNPASNLGLVVLVVLGVIGCGRDDTPARAGTAAGNAAQAETENKEGATAGGISEIARHYAARCENAKESMTALLGALEVSGDAPSVDSVFEPFNELTRQIDNNMYEAQLLFYVHPNDDVRRIAGECDQEFQGLNTALFLSRPIYEAFAAVDLVGEDAETRYFAEKQLLQFRLNGVGEDDDTRQRIKDLRTEIIGLEQAFASNIATDVGSIMVDSETQLAGLPRDWIDSHPPDEEGKIRVTTQYPDYMPFMRYAEDESLRRALYFKYNNRAYPANEDVLAQLVEKRHELAQLTGFDTWAEAMNVTKMSGSAAAVRRFIDKASEAARDRAQADYETYLARLRQDTPDAEAVMPWQGSYIGNVLRKERFAMDAAEIRPYFEYHKVRDGIFELTQDLFGYSIRPVEAAVWHESVQAYEMWEGDRLLGSFFLDMHPREDKFNHAGMFQIEVGQKDKHLPSAALVTNFPGASGKGFMELRQVETFLHEFGHLIHWLTMGHQRWVRNTDPEWDFIEAPSQMLENWLYDPDTVRRFARNDTGEPIPVEMISKIKQADDFGQGLFVLGQIELADLSLSLHDRDPVSFRIEALVDVIDDRYRLFGEVDGVHDFAAFAHLANAPYAASYYLYMWSLVIADDMFSRFQSEGLRNRATAFDYRDEVLAKGGSRPAAESVAAFLGRSFNFDAFQQRLGERP